eukprot:gene12784-15000_t
MSDIEDAVEDQKGFYVTPIACMHLTDPTLAEECLDLGIFDGADPDTTTPTKPKIVNEEQRSPTFQEKINQDFESSESEDEQEVAQKSGLLKTMLGFANMLIGKTVPPMADLSLQSVADHIKSGKCKNIIVLTGAGISVAAGIPDFRSPKTGLYHNLAKYNLPYKTAIFDMEYFVENPKPFFVLAKELYPGSFIPTPVHHFIKLLSDKGLLLRNYTQNIDTLERISNIPEELLVEAHGTFASAKCIKCKNTYPCEYVRDELPYCSQEGCGGIVKPDIVFFGEALPSRFSDMVRKDFPKCDMLLVIGTSLQVQPFASLISLAPQGIPRLLINMEEVGENTNGGFRFNDQSNKTDAKFIGDCQDGIKELTKCLGWEDLLAEIANSIPTTITTPKF